MGYQWHNQGMGGGWWVLMAVGVIIFLALFAVAMVALTRQPGRNSPTAHQSSTNRAVEILHERLARGEVNEEEYAKRVALLRDKT